MKIHHFIFDFRIRIHIVFVMHDFFLEIFEFCIYRFSYSYLLIKIHIDFRVCIINYFLHRFDIVLRRATCTIVRSEKTVEPICYYFHH